MDMCSFIESIKDLFEKMANRVKNVEILIGAKHDTAWLLKGFDVRPVSGNKVPQPLSFELPIIQVPSQVTRPPAYVNSPNH